MLEDVIDPEKVEEEPVENKMLKKFEHQNEIKKKSRETRTKMKESRIRLTFEKKKKIHTDNDYENNNLQDLNNVEAEGWEEEEYEKYEK